MPKGVLLVGPPGTGKTLLARAVAGEAGVTFFSISASQFIEMFVGVGASRVRDLFTNAKKAAPSIIFIDELDAVGRSRGAGFGGGHDEREQTLNQLLSEMDGFDQHEEVIVLAATNRPDVLDPALLRPGRFDRHVVIERPDWRDREKILQVHARKIALAEGVDLSVIARGTPGMTGADLENLVNEAAILASREDAAAVTMEHLEKAKDKILMGGERKMFISPEEKRITAYHEAGHTLVARLLPGTDPIHKVTIIPRGMALGVTQQLPEDDRYHYPQSYLEKRLAVTMGGRVAERLVFGEVSTGAQSDLKMVTDLAEKMVCQWGMSEKVGAMTFSRGEEHPFLGMKLAEEKTFSEAMAWLIDQEIAAFIRKAEQQAEELLTPTAPSWICLRRRCRRKRPWTGRGWTRSSARIRLREPEKTNIPFYITSSGRLCRSFNRKILNVALLRLRFCSIRNGKSNLNPRVKLGISVFSGSLNTQYLTTAPSGSFATDQKSINSFKLEMNSPSKSALTPSLIRTAKRQKP